MKTRTLSSPFKNPKIFWLSLYHEIISSSPIAWRILISKLQSRYRQSILGWAWAFLPSLITMLVFIFLQSQNILKIDDNDIQMIMKEINQEDLLIGLKTATDELKEKLFTNMSERAALMMKEDLESLGPTKISEVEKAQQKVIAVCKKLEEDGKLVIGGGADTLV